MTMKTVPVAFEICSTLKKLDILAFLKNIFTAEAERTRRSLFFIKSGDTGFMKDPVAFGGLRVREAMSGFPLAASPAKGKKTILCVLGVSAVNRAFTGPSEKAKLIRNPRFSFLDPGLRRDDGLGKT
jgi:hypothetical protein